MKEHLQQAKRELGILDWRKNLKLGAPILVGYVILLFLIIYLRPWMWMQSFFSGAPEGALKFYFWLGLGVVIFVPAAIISIYRIRRDRASSGQEPIDYL